MTTRSPAETLRRILASDRLDLHTAMPCRVEAFDPTGPTVDVQPMIKNVLRDPDGTERVASYPLIRNVPVQYSRSKKFIGSAFPLEKGDFVQVLFNERSIDQFYEQGKEVHPVDLEKHGFSGAVAYPGMAPKSQPIQEDISEDLVVGVDGGAVLRAKPDGSMQLGATAAIKQPAAMGDSVKAQLDALAKEINDLKTIIAATWVPMPHDGGLALQVAAATWSSSPVTVSEVGSSKIEVEE